jgi:uncharacterized phage protein (TIGR01671 family)
MIQTHSSAGIAQNPLLGTVRQIKLRLWNPEAKVVTGGNELNTILLTTDGEFVKEFNRCKMIWMENLPLQDIKGKDIYDGDIVKVSLPAFDENDKPKAVNYEVSIKSTGYFIGKWNFHGSYYFGSVRHLEIEIVGNIYQNPELLG